jgi:hypothetical protein
MAVFKLSDPNECSCPACQRDVDDFDSLWNLVNAGLRARELAENGERPPQEPDGG